MTESSQSPARSKVFVSYSRKDKKWLERLRIHFKPLEREGLVDIWADTKIKAGQRWHDEIIRALDEARIAVLLVSPHFLASNFILDHELPQLLRAEEQRGLVVFVVLINPSSYERTELVRFKAVNDPRKTLSEMSPAQRDRVFVRMVEDVEELLSWQGWASEVSRGPEVEAILNEVRESGVKQLNLRNMGLLDVPVELAALKQLTTIYLSKNRLRQVPAVFNELDKLTTLYLSRNDFRVFPLSVTRLPRLRELYFSVNKLVTLPSAIGEMRRLKKLDLSKNKLKRLPSEIGLLTHLEELYLTDNELTYVPSEIGQLKKLKKLHLSNNRLSRLPAELNQLSELEDLNVDGNLI